MRIGVAVDSVIFIVCGSKIANSDKGTAMDQQNFPRKIFTHRVLIATGIIGMTVILLLFFWYFAYVLLLVFAGILLAVFLRSLAEWLSAHTPLSVGWSLTLVILFLLEGAGIGVSLLGPSIMNSFDQLTQIIPQALERIQDFISKHGMIKKQLLEDFLQSSKKTLITQDMFARMAGIFSNIIGLIVGIVVILANGLYFSAEPKIYTHSAVRLISPSKRERVRAVLTELGRALRWWLAGRIIAMIVVGVLTWAGLFLLSVPAAAALAFLAMMLGFIPNIGPILAAAPAILAGGMQGGLITALYVALLYIAVQFFEGYLVTPLVQQRTVSIPPALTLTVQLMMGFAFGILGLLLATPLAVVILVLVQMLYLEDILGDQVDLI
jgi:predicted PurR-regulated permease PerM